MGDLQMFPVQNRRIAAKVNTFHCFFFHDKVFFLVGHKMARIYLVKRKPLLKNKDIMNRT